jgi:hypothetical protein
MRVTTIAVAKKVIVATRLAGDAIALPLSPLPEVHPPAIIVPRPVSSPAANRMTTMRMVPPVPLNVSVSQG